MRERPSDIIPLAQFFADKYAEANGVDKKKIGQSGEDKLKAYNWRGNIRELENTMHRAILMSLHDDIEGDDIAIQGEAFGTSPPSPPASGGEGASEASARGGGSPLQNPGAVESMIGRTIADVERDMILNTLDHTLGNRTHAAQILGISIRTLRNKLNQYKDEGVNIPAASG